MFVGSLLFRGKIMSTFNWLPITELYKYAKEGALILALTDHGADKPIVVEEAGREVLRLSTYLAHADGMGHVNDGYHVLVFGGEYSEDDWESGIRFTVPAWWFLNDGDFETPGNPIKFIPLTETESEK